MVGGDGSRVVLYGLGAGGEGGRIRWKGWGRFFWLVWTRRGDRGDLRTDVERRDVAMLVLALALRVVVKRDGAGGCANERGDVGGVVVEGVSVGVDGVVVTAAAVVVAAVGGVVVERLGWRCAGVDGTDSVDVGLAFAVAVAGSGVGIAGASLAGVAGGVDVAVAVIVFVFGDVVVVVIEAVVGVDVAGGGDGAGGVVGVEGVCGIDGAVAPVAAVVAVAVKG